MNRSIRPLTAIALAATATLLGTGAAHADDTSATNDITAPTTDTETDFSLILSGGDDASNADDTSATDDITAPTTDTETDFSLILSGGDDADGIGVLDWGDFGVTAGDDDTADVQPDTECITIESGIIVCEEAAAADADGAAAHGTDDFTSGDDDDVAGATIVATLPTGSRVPTS